MNAYAREATRRLGMLGEVAARADIIPLEYLWRRSPNVQAAVRADLEHHARVAWDRELAVELFGTPLAPSQPVRPIPIVLPEGNKHEDRGHWSDPAFPDCRACNLADHVMARG